jgi:Spy/CpxP family protein refolding chaperone
MQNKNSKVVKQAVTIVAIIALTTAIGVAVGAQTGADRGQTGGPGSGGPGGRGMRSGPGMMGWRGQMGGPGMMGGPGGGPFGMLGRGMRELGVTDEQREQIRIKMESYKPRFEDIADRMTVARKALEDAITAEPVNDGAIRAAAAAVADVEADAAVLRATVHQDVFSVLTPEQRQKAKDLRGQMEQRMKDGRQRMKEGRQQIKQSTKPTRGGSELV